MPKVPRSSHTPETMPTPGMQHCYGGPGPNFFGQVDLSSLGPNTQQLSTDMDPEHNVLAALERRALHPALSLRRSL